MGILITLNETNVINDGTNTSYLYTFPNGGYRFKDDMIALNTITNISSSLNISSALGNNMLYYGWPNSINSIEADTDIIPDGAYSIFSLNAFFQSRMYARGQYLIKNSNGSIVYFMNLSLDPASNRVVLNTYNLSTTAYQIGFGNAYSYPSNANWVLSNRSPNIELIPQTFYQVIGFNIGVYPSSITAPNSVFTGTSLPQLLKNKVINVNCNIVANRAVIPNDLLFAYTPKGDPNTIQTYTPMADFNWVRITDGLYNTLEIQLRDGLDNSIFKQLNPQTTITLYIKNKNEFDEINI